MASKFLKHFGIGGKKPPPPPPKPDYNQIKTRSSDSLVPSPISDQGSSVSVSTTTSQILEFDAPSSPLRPAPGEKGGGGARPKDSGGGISPKYSTSERTPLPSTSGSQEAEGPQQAEGEQGAVGGSGRGFPKLEDEYSDPIDLKSFREEMEGTCVPPVTEDDYSVPYEVKKLFKGEHEIRLNNEGGDGDSPGRKGGLKGPRNYPYEEGASGFSPVHRPLGPDTDKLDYDAPWEWTQGLIMEGNSPPHIFSNQNRTPQLARTKLTTAGSLDSEPDSDKLPLSMNVQYDAGPRTPTQNTKDEDSDDDNERGQYYNLGEWIGDQETGAEAAPAPVVATGGATAGPDKRPGNYEEPWDLTAKQKELEDKFRAASDRASKEKASATAPVEQQGAEEAQSQAGAPAAQPGASTAAAGPSQTSSGQQASGSGPDPRTADTRPQQGYEKPWDWKPHQKDDRPMEGYEKPWDWKPHEKDDRPPGEYDEPWDQKQEELKQNILAAKGKESSKEEDTRPPEEYEEPWDQKQAKKSASRAGSSSDSSPKSSQSPVMPHPGQQSPKKKTLQLELGSRAWNPPGERVDPKIPLDQQGWYHGSISRVDAENLLRVHKEGSYLVRMSESNKLDYSLSLKSARGFMHMKIVNRDGKFILGQFSQPFESISQMIYHYSISKLPIKGAEHMSLLHPVINELL